MRSRKAELSEVEKQFESWRSKPHGRLIPEELWNAAVGLILFPYSDLTASVTCWSPHALSTGWSFEPGF